MAYGLKARSCHPLTRENLFFFSTIYLFVSVESYGESWRNIFGGKSWPKVMVTVKEVTRGEDLRRVGSR